MGSDGAGGEKTVRGQGRMPDPPVVQIPCLVIGAGRPDPDQDHPVQQPLGEPVEVFRIGFLHELGFDLLAACPQIAAGERIPHACFVSAGLGDRPQDGFVIGDAEREVLAVGRDDPVEPVDGPGVPALLRRQPQL